MSRWDASCELKYQGSCGCLMARNMDVKDIANGSRVPRRRSPYHFFACVFRSRTRWPAIPRNCACDYNPPPTFA